MATKRKHSTFFALLLEKPAQLMLAAFSIVIVLGTFFLVLPISSSTGTDTPLIDALFTATSATCVTGLVVQDTGAYFSLFGQCVILCLIQLGGLGIMTFSVSLALLLGKNINLERLIVMKDVLDQDTLQTTRNLTVFILKMTLIFELLGTAALFIAWYDRAARWPQTFYYALFHSISAFCNAGFSLFRDSLSSFSGCLMTNVIVCILIVAGGLGFPAILNTTEWVKGKFYRRIRPINKLKVQTKIAILTSAFLIVIGALVFYLFETNHLFGTLKLKETWLASIFLSVTSRTAGFNTCNTAALSAPTLFLVIVFMFIGASPASTGGGVKTSTAFVLWAVLVNEFKNKANVETFRRNIPVITIKKAISVLMSSASIIVMFALLLLYIEKKVFIDVLFETVSAFGTVGLSTGITPLLSSAGKALITVLMFIGRLGPLTIGYAFLSRKSPARYRYANERIMIG